MVVIVYSRFYKTAILASFIVFFTHLTGENHASATTLYHCPHSRSTGVLTLLEELHAPYELHVMNMKKGENREAAYLAVNPMGKVPAIRHGDAVVTEQVAIYLYLPTCSRKRNWRRRSAIRSAGLTCAGWRSTAAASSRPCSTSG
jgi:glutathione S-transferase